MAEPPASLRAVRPLHVPKVAELVADDIRRDIATGVYTDGAELPQGTELMTRYEISRPTLREALRVLASENLLEMAAGTTTVRVRLPSAEVAGRYAGLLLQLRGTTVRDLEESRTVIEGPVAAMLAERAQHDAAILDELETAIVAEAEALTRDDHVEVGRAGLRVHDAVVKLSGNTTLHAVSSLLGSVIERHTAERITETRELARAAGAEELRRAHRAHRRFLELVRAGEAEKASAQWVRHVESITAALLASGESSHVVDLFSSAVTAHAGRPRSSTVAQTLATKLRHQIVTGKLALGTRLPAEPEMRERFDVSRATLRSALRVLESEGLLKIHRGARGGAEVIHPPATTAGRYFGLLLQSRDTTLADFQAAREILEPPLAAAIARNADEQSIGRLRGAIDLEAQLVSEPERYGLATVRFHDLVAELSGSATLWVVMDLMDGVMQRHAEVRLREEARLPELRKSHRAHARLVELVEARDEDGARRLWQAHVEELGGALLRSSSRSRVVDLFD